MMNFLLDPNIAYLFLLGGVFLAMLALATPGTGFFELLGIFSLVLAGYAVYNLSFTWWALVLLVLSIVPFVYSIQKPKRELYLVLAIVFLVVGSVFMFPRTEGKAVVNPFVAIVASGFVSGFLWIAVRKSIEASSIRPIHDLEGLAGALGEARTKIHEEGSVMVDGELWSARSDSPIPAKSPIKVIRREGFTLVVEKSNSSKS